MVGVPVEVMVRIQSETNVDGLLLERRCCHGVDVTFKPQLRPNLDLISIWTSNSRWTDLSLGEDLGNDIAESLNVLVSCQSIADTQANGQGNLLAL